MKSMEKSRLELLQESLVTNPDATFVRYALAMELSNAESPDEAWRHFEYLLNCHPEYAPTYFHAGKLLLKLGRPEAARDVFIKGIEVTGRQGNMHTQSELQAALDELQTSK
jgi:tetratricopeptide (TPR) repeat protein